MAMLARVKAKATKNREPDPNKVDPMVQWINNTLKKSSGLTVEFLADDLKDGTILASLVETLSGVPVNGIMMNPINAGDRRSNLKALFQRFEDDDLETHDTKPSHLLLGTATQINKLLVSMQLHYTGMKEKFAKEEDMAKELRRNPPKADDDTSVPSTPTEPAMPAEVEMTKMTPEEAAKLASLTRTILPWVQERLRPKGLRPTNLSTDFSDGAMLNFLLDEVTNTPGKTVYKSAEASDNVDFAISRLLTVGVHIAREHVAALKVNDERGTVRIVGTIMAADRKGLLR